MTFLIRQCYRCSGKGFRYVKDWFDPTDVVPETCDLCNGTGKLPPETTEGDGRLSRLAAAGMCLRCETFLDGNLTCPVCKLVYGDRHET